MNNRDEYEDDLREQCKWDEFRAKQLDREDRSNQTGDYAPKDAEGEGWTPAYSDIEWTKQLITSLKEGGTWLVPANKSIWTFWQETKQAQLKSGDANDETNYRIKTILEEYLEYTILPS